MSVDYTKVNWKNSPSTQTPLNATNLNKMDTAIDDVANWINQNEDKVGDESGLIAAPFSTTKAYSKGDLVVYEKQLYAAKNNVAAGAWNESNFETVTVSDKLDELKAAIDEIEPGGGGSVDPDPWADSEVIRIPITMEPGSYNSDRTPQENAIRSRSVAIIPALFGIGSFKFPSDCKTRLVYYSVTRDSSTGTITYTGKTASAGTEFITTPYEIAPNDAHVIGISSLTSIVISLLVSYQDERAITADNVPEVYFEYTLSNPAVAWPFSAGYTVTDLYVPGFRSYVGDTPTRFAYYPVPVIPGHTYQADYLGITWFFDDHFAPLFCIGHSKMMHDNTVIAPVGAAYMMTVASQNVVAESGLNHVTDVTTELNYLSGYSYSIIGDSISAYEGVIPSENVAYYHGNDYGVSSPDEMWWGVFERESGAQRCMINAWSGSGVTQLENDAFHIAAVPGSDDRRCTNLHQYSQKPDLIILAIGGNDYQYAMSNQSLPLEWDISTTPTIENSFTEAYACMIKKLRTNYPKALIVAITPNGDPRSADGFPGSRVVSDHAWTANDYCEAIIQVCKAMRVPYISRLAVGLHKAIMYPEYAQDSETSPNHYNAKGQAVYGRLISEAIKPLTYAYLPPISNS